MIYLPHFDTGVPLFIMLHFIASQILFVVVGGGGGVSSSLYSDIRQRYCMKN